MDRQTWLADRQAAVVADYDGDAEHYDNLEYPADMQREWVGRVLEMIPQGGTVLDAPCGTGRYFSQITAAGLRVAGADQSAGMLAQARARATSPFRWSIADFRPFRMTASSTQC
jgi:ubiquinone/menaquinone biosynthesis C-methylase UbiE